MGPSAATEPGRHQKRKLQQADSSDDDFLDGDAEGLFDDFDVDAAVAPAPSKRQRHQGSEDNASHLELARNILKEKFGYDNFRHEQEAAISRILAGQNALVIFPTGAGKSLCFQIPALAFEHMDRQSGTRGPGESGITLVVSPLIALMKDQVDSLRRRGIPAECIDSTKKAHELHEINAALRNGQVRIIYCAPERLNNERFVESMKEVAGGVRLIAVDEAHCISEWGDSFRPDYLKVARFVDEIRAERVICLTATATPPVAQDIRKAFDIGEPGVFQTSPYRPNLQLLAESVAAKTDKYPKLFRFLEQHPGSTIIYVTLQQQAESLASDLRKKGFSARHFHAGMRADVKSQTQDDFMASKVPIVVATIAFGMGIDKSDIRNIVHCDLPMTVEEYSQQVGRAGRDGKSSTCVLYICPDDFYMRENFARGDLPSRESLNALLRDIFNDEVLALPVGDTFLVNQAAHSNDYDIRRSPVSIIYAALELRFGLIRAVTPEYSDYKFEASKAYYPVMKEDSSPESKAIFACAKKAAKYHHIDVSQVAKDKGLLRSDLVRLLTKLNDRGVITLTASGVRTKFRILKQLPSTDKEMDDICDKLYRDMERREQDALRRTREVADLFTGDVCFALALAEHFGVGLPGGKPKCGHCTHCLTKKKVVLPPPPQKAVDMAGIQKVLDATNIRDDPRFLARVAFGIKSPRVVKMGLHNNAAFMSLADHEFQSLIREFEAACRSAKVEGVGKT